MAMKTVSLVLGSGGARGMAHVGVIRCVQERGLDIRSISGCSIGALIGGVHALDKIDELTDWLSVIRRRDVISLLDLSFRGEGLFKGDNIIDRLRGFLGDAVIEDLPITYTAVAADIRKGREVWIDSGPLFDAIRASISLPLFFTPFPYNGAKLFDGGLLNPVPVAPTVRDTTDLTIAVNLGGPPRRAPQTAKKEEASADGKKQALHRRVVDFIEDLKDGLPSMSPRELGMYEIAQSSFDAMQGTLARHQLAAYRPDVEIVIARDTCNLLDFDRAEELVELGYRTADAALGAADSSS
jgi:NTE family protein